jgi:uncharacterized phage protein gp47/JayE
MVENISFKLKRQEEITASMAAYLAGHTTLVNDFSQGSIIRSIIESVAQEIFRQNVSFAQGVVESIRNSVKQAFGLPLKEASKAYGNYTFYRKMLSAPSGLSVAFNSSAISFTGSISGNTLTVAAPVPSDTLRIGHHISGSTVADGTQIIAYGTGSTGGVGTYIVSGPTQTVSQATLSAYGKFSPAPTMTVGAITSTGGFLAPSPYYWSVTGVFRHGMPSGSGATFNLASGATTVTTGATIASAGAGYTIGDVLSLGGLSGKIRVETVTTSGGITSFSIDTAANNNTYSSGATGLTTSYYLYALPYKFVESSASTPVSATLTGVSTQKVALSWTPIANVTGYKIYRSDNIQMLNAVYYYVSGQSTSTFTDTGVVATSGQLNGSIAGNASVLTVGTYTGTSNITTGQRLYSGSSFLGTITQFALVDVATNTPYSGTNAIAGSSAVTGLGGVGTYKISNYNSSGSAVTNIVLYPAYAKWPSTQVSWGVTAVNLTNGIESETIGTSTRITPSGSIAQFAWSPTSSADTNSAPTGYNVYRSESNLSLSAPSSISITATSGGSILYQSSSFTGVISGTTLTASSVTDFITEGQTISGTGVAFGTKIIKALSSTTYEINISQNVSSVSMRGFLTYYWSIATLTNAGESVGSSPKTLDQLNVFSNSNRTASISWASVSSAIGYRVYRSTASDMSENLCFYDTIYNYFKDDGSQNITTNTYVSYKCIDHWTLPYFVGKVTSSLIVNTLSSWRIYDPNIINATRFWPSQSNAFAVQGSITVPAGSQLNVPGTSKYYTVSSKFIIDAYSSSGSTAIEAVSSGSLGNTPANTITSIVSPIYGIFSGTNAGAFVTGSDIETEEEWRVRFSKVLQDLAKGTSYAIEVGAQNAKLYDENGIVYEEVIKSLAYEPSNQVVDLYIHNGLDTGCSTDLIAYCQKIINGFIDEQGIKKAGYKPAGIPVTVKKSIVQTQNILVSVIPNSGYSLNILSDSITLAIQTYFSNLDISDGFVVPSISSVVVNSTGAISYQYQLIAVDANGNRSYPSSVFFVSSCSAQINNTVNFTPNATMASYELLRWENTAWGLVATIVKPPEGWSAQTYVDTVLSLTSYSFSLPIRKIFQKSALSQKIMETPGVASVIVSSPTTLGVEQDMIVPTVGYILVPGTITLR